MPYCLSSFLYSRPAPTYETASIRKFYHGRTETVRSCTVEVVEWCKAMLDPDVSVSFKYISVGISYCIWSTSVAEFYIMPVFDTYFAISNSHSRILL